MLWKHSFLIPFSPSNFYINFKISALLAVCAFPTWMTRPSLWRGAPRQKPSLASWSKPRPHPRPRATYPFRGPSNPACVHMLLQVNINRNAEKRQRTAKITTLTLSCNFRSGARHHVQDQHLHAERERTQCTFHTHCHDRWALNTSEFAVTQSSTFWSVKKKTSWYQR